MADSWCIIWRSSHINTGIAIVRNNYHWINGLVQTSHNSIVVMSHALTFWNDIISSIGMPCLSSLGDRGQAVGRADPALVWATGIVHRPLALVFLTSILYSHGSRCWVGTRISMGSAGPDPVLALLSSFIRVHTSIIQTGLQGERGIPSRLLISVDGSRSP